MLHSILPKVCDTVSKKLKSEHRLGNWNTHKKSKIKTVESEPPDCAYLSVLPCQFNPERMF